MNFNQQSVTLYEEKSKLDKEKNGKQNILTNSSPKQHSRKSPIDP